MDCKSTIHRFESGRRLHISPWKPVVNRRKRIVLGVILVSLALALTVSGYIFGNPLVIFQKAANICLECIGVG